MRKEKAFYLRMFTRDINIRKSMISCCGWMVSGPELARLVKEFENSDKDQYAQLPHHEQSHASQTRFKNHVRTLVSTIGAGKSIFKKPVKILFH